jgi:hypothetical protein
VEDKVNIFGVLKYRLTPSFVLDIYFVNREPFSLLKRQRYFDAFEARYKNGLPAAPLALEHP